jgi:hypothetical protein
MLAVEGKWECALALSKKQAALLRIKFSQDYTSVKSPYSAEEFYAEICLAHGTLSLMLPMLVWRKQVKAHGSWQLLSLIRPAAKPNN